MQSEAKNRARRKAILTILWALSDLIEEWDADPLVDLDERLFGTSLIRLIERIYDADEWHGRTPPKAWDPPPGIDKATAILRGWIEETAKRAAGGEAPGGLSVIDRSVESARGLLMLAHDALVLSETGSAWHVAERLRAEGRIGERDIVRDIYQPLRGMAENLIEYG